MSPNERAGLIQRYAGGYADVADALRNTTDQELDFRYAPGKWSSREIVHHLADSETTSAIRLRRLLAEENPLIQGYDQDEFARRLRYDERPVEAAMMAIQAAITTTLQLLETMSEPDWQRKGTHSEIGEYSTERWLEIYAVHAHNHAAQIRRNREAFRDRDQLATTT